MPPETTTALIENPTKPASTEGMTAKVVKGSLWTLVGLLIPTALALAVSKAGTMATASYRKAIFLFFAELLLEKSLCSIVTMV
ncbi:MAG: hypothetical protein M3Q26_07210 [Acidobacteriota bacterium]|nr:hypothetical protein [Acidobacteriota bacterium]